MSTDKLASNAQSEITFRIPFLHETETVIYLFEQMIDTAFPMFSSLALEYYKDQWTKKKIEERLKHPSDLLLTAWDHENPAALISGTHSEGGVGTIIWLLVHAKYRNKDIGSTLFKLGCEYYEKMGCHKIKLTAPSERAKKFYEKQGMKVEGFHPKHWWNVDYWSLSLML